MRILKEKISGPGVSQGGMATDQTDTCIKVSIFILYIYIYILFYIYIISTSFVPNLSPLLSFVQLYQKVGAARCTMSI